MPRVTKTFKPTESSDISSQTSDKTVEKSADDLVGEGSVIARSDENVGPWQSQNNQDLPAGKAGIASSQASRNDDENSGYRSGYRNPNYDRSYSDRDVPTEEVSGILDIMSEGHGFLRPKYIPSDRDVYISASQIRRFNLRPGDLVEGKARPPKETERYFGLLQVDTVNGENAEKMVSDPAAGSAGRVKRTGL